MLKRRSGLYQAEGTAILAFQWVSFFTCSSRVRFLQFKNSKAMKIIEIAIENKDFGWLWVLCQRVEGRKPIEPVCAQRSKTIKNASNEEVTFVSTIQMQTSLKG